MTKIESEDRQTTRAKLAKESGYTGYSLLWRLHNLYGFDVFRDLVFDMMHNIPLNLLKNHLRYYIDYDLIDVNKVQERLDQFPWPAGL